MTRTTERTPRSRKPARLKRPAALVLVALVALLLAACQPGAGITPSASVSAVTLQGPGTQVRQGHGLVTVEVTGEQIADIAVATLGGLGGDVILNNSTAATIEFTIPHGAPLGMQTLQLTTGVGPASFANALEITPITSGPAGNDLTGIGTAEDPFRSLAHALTIADPGDTVMLLDGTYTAANGEVWPTLVPAGLTIRGESQGGTLLDGELAGVHGLVLGDGAHVADLSATGFNYAVAVGGADSASIENIRAYQNALAGVATGNTAQLQVTGGRFDQNAIGMRSLSGSTMIVSGTQVDGNASIGILVDDASTLYDTGSSVEAQPFNIRVIDSASATLDGTAATSGTTFGLWISQTAAVTALNATFDANLYGVYLSDGAQILVEGGSASNNLRDGFFFANTSSATLEGVAVHDNDDDKLGGTCFSGIAAFTTGQLRLRDTSFADNCFGLYTATEASLFDLGTAADPGGNTFVNSTNFHLYDNRPALGAPVGTVMTVVGTSFDGVEPSGGVSTGIDQQVVGSNWMWRINNANQRMEFQP